MKDCMIKQTVFTERWSFDFDNLEIYETPFNTFYVRNNITHYVIMPNNATVADRIRATLNEGIHPFSLEWYSESGGGIGANHFEVLDLGEYYE